MDALTYIGVCSGPARIASLDLSLYFSSRLSPFVTCISSRGFPRQKRGYVWAIAIVVFELKVVVEKNKFGVII